MRSKSSVALTVVHERCQLMSLLCTGTLGLADEVGVSQQRHERVVLIEVHQVYLYLCKQTTKHPIG